MGRNSDSKLILGEKDVELLNMFDSVFAGSIEGSGGVVKRGMDTLTLSGQSTYTEDTIIETGRLILAENSSLASAVTVGLAGKFEFSTKTGSIGGLKTESGSSLVFIEKIKVNGTAELQTGTLFDFSAQEFEQFYEDNFVLIETSGGITVDESLLLGYTAGDSLFLVELGLEADSERLYGTVLARSTAPQTKSFLEGRMASMGMIRQHQDWLPGYGYEMLNGIGVTVHGH